VGVVGQEGVYAGIVDDVGELRRRQPEVERDEGRSDASNREQRLEERRLVESNERDSITRPDASVSQPRGDARGTRPDLPANLLASAA
jgi:hypothetical protein